MFSYRNACTVKYIHLASVDPSLLHTTVDYELYTATVRHNSYSDLHDAVFSACPAGYVCKEPIALFHEVQWSTGIRITATGESERVRLERDELHHAIEEWEYDVLWPRGTSKSPVHAPTTICVDVDELAGAASVAGM